MNKSLDKQIDQAWDFVWNKLYCKDTKLVYDYLTEGGATACLPTLEEIEA